MSKRAGKGIRWTGCLRLLAVVQVSLLGVEFVTSLSILDALMHGEIQYSRVVRGPGKLTRRRTTFVLEKAATRAGAGAESLQTTPLRPLRRALTIGPALRMIRMLHAFAVMLPLWGCMATEPVLCERQPYHSIASASGGAEDIVSLALGAGHTRLFVREVCRGWSCSDQDSRIGFADIRTASGDPKGTAPDRTAFGWRPGAERFEPLGMSLVPGSVPGHATLYVLDAVGSEPIRRLSIKDGSIENQASTHRLPRNLDILDHANDLQAVGEVFYVTRFDALGLLSWRPGTWYGIVHVSPDGGLVEYEPGFRGANGIVDLAPERDALLVSDYWNRRLRLIPKKSDGPDVTRFGTAALPIHPDNLTRQGSRILIAGQRNWFFASLNIVAPFMPSPSAVYAIDIAALGEKAEPELLWDGGWSHGRSVSVAAPIPGGLALGQIRSPGVLLVRCQPP